MLATEVRTGCSGLDAAKSWKPLRMEVAQPLWAACCSTWLSSWENFLLLFSCLLTMWRAPLGIPDIFPVGAGGLQVGQPLLAGHMLQPPAGFLGLCWAHSRLLILVFFCRGAQNWMQDCRCSLTSAEERERITLLYLPAVFLLTQPRRPS